ncbi:thioredoxin [bacterium Unc6]|nr:thioredoxin [bacterium Unc6]
MSDVKELNETNFESVISNSAPVLIDFFAPWCGPCKMMSPIIDRVAKEFEGKLNVYKINIDENKTLASRYGIMSVPTLIFFKSSKEVTRSVGLVNIGEIKRKIEDILKQ